MSIFAGSDLISDVGRAALPSRKAEALHRLQRFANTPEAVAATPTTTKTDHNYSDTITSFVILPVKSSTLLNAAAPDNKEASLAFRKFEAFILQTCLELLLPKADSGAYGSDESGALWRSLMAEHLGNQLAETGALRLARLTEHSLHQTKNVLASSRIELIGDSNQSHNPAQIKSASPFS